MNEKTFPPSPGQLASSNVPCSSRIAWLTQSARPAPLVPPARGRLRIERPAILPPIGHDLHSLDLAKFNAE